jgi:hypothetical protein
VDPIHEGVCAFRLRSMIEDHIISALMFIASRLGWLLGDVPARAYYSSSSSSGAASSGASSTQGWRTVTRKLPQWKFRKTQNPSPPQQRRAKCCALKYGLYAVKIDTLLCRMRYNPINNYISWLCKALYMLGRALSTTVMLCTLEVLEGVLCGLESLDAVQYAAGCGCSL